MIISKYAGWINLHTNIFTAQAVDIQNGPFELFEMFSSVGTLSKFAGKGMAKTIYLDVRTKARFICIDLFGWQPSDFDFV